ncbi:MAG: hypothetical protein R3E72_06900 [Steroidobacteraceae bacterium]
MLTGKPVRGDKALRLGLVDRLVPLEQLTNAARDSGADAAAAAPGAKGTIALVARGPWA